MGVEFNREILDNSKIFSKFLLEKGIELKKVSGSIFYLYKIFHRNRETRFQRLIAKLFGETYREKFCNHLWISADEIRIYAEEKDQEYLKNIFENSYFSFPIKIEVVA